MLRLVIDPRRVAGEEHVVELEQRTVEGSGSTSNTSRPAPRRRPERKASQRAASSTRPPRAVLIKTEPGFMRASVWRIDQVPSLGRQGRMQRDIIGAGQQIVERRQLDCGPFGRNSPGRVRLVGQHLHPHADGARRHRLTDAAQTDDAQASSPSRGGRWSASTFRRGRGGPPWESRGPRRRATQTCARRPDDG